MWVLSHIESRHKLYILCDKDIYTVGRIQHDLMLLGDQSVSRDHAIIHRSAEGITVEDKSRFGVFINKGIETNKGIGIGPKVKLKVGDVVRFGRLKSIFRIEEMEFKVCCSMMPPDDVKNFVNQLNIFDGKLESAWSQECTHLVMTTIVVTMKVLQSLIQGIPIVTKAYFDALLKQIRENSSSELPNVNDFVPEITEPFLIKEPGSMQVHLDRQRIFQGKTFVFMVKRHMTNFQSVIELAAGKCVSLEECRLSKKMLLKQNYIPVAYSPVGASQCSEDVNGIVTYIEANNRRLIAEAEIGLAIIHRSIDRFCNPDHKINGDFQVNTLNSNELRVNILVENTPSGRVPSKMCSPNTESIVPETANSTDTEPNNNCIRNKTIESDEIALDLNKPSTSKSGAKSKSVTPYRSPTTRASSKRKLNVVDNVENEPSNEELTKNTRTKKAKQINEEKDGDIAVSSKISSLSSELMPPPASNVILHSQSFFLDSSGFISTQHRKRTPNITANTNPVELEHTKELTKEQKEQNRKRAIALLNADSDDENDQDDGQLFAFSKKPAKKSKFLAKNNSESRVGKKRTFVDVSDDDDDDHDDDSNDANPFQFSKSKIMRSQQKQQKKKRSNQQNYSENIDVDSPDHGSMETENSFITQRKTQMMKSNNETTLDIKETSIVSTEWIISKMNEKLDLNGTKRSVAETKKEKYQNNDSESWAQSLANVFQTRRIDVNLTRNSLIDETDSVSISPTTSSTLNKSKNFKKFVKKNNFIKSTVAVKTTSTPVVVSAYCRL